MALARVAEAQSDDAGAGSTSLKTTSRIPSRIASLLAKWRYIAIASTPSACPSSRIVNASIPRVSAISRAARRIRPLVSGGRLCRTLDMFTLYPYHRTCLFTQYTRGGFDGSGTGDGPDDA